MAKRVSKITLGIDVSKDELVIYRWDSEELFTLANEADVIKAWLKTLLGPVRIAIEPTSTYHLCLIDQAHALGYTVYLVNPRQLVHYRKAVNLRHKSDPDDAWLLARFLENEGKQLRAFTPPSRKAQQLWVFIKRRAVVVEARKKLQQSLADTQLAHQALITELKVLLVRIEKRIKVLIRELGWLADYRRCLSIPGIGPVNAAALVCAFNRGAFASCNAFIAYLGLDIKRRESGRYKGQRKLTKHGESEMRRLLWCTAQPARSYAPFEHYYQAQIDKGFPKTAAKIILGRKIARIAFSLLTKKQTFKKMEIAY